MEMPMTTSGPTSNSQKAVSRWNNTGSAGSKLTDSRLCRSVHRESESMKRPQHIDGMVSCQRSSALESLWQPFQKAANIRRSPEKK